MPRSTERQRPSRRSRGWLLIAGLGLPLVLCALLLLALRSGRGRDYLAHTAGRVVSELLVGEIRIGSVRELSGAWIVLSDVECRDSAGQAVVRAKRVEALLSLSALLDGNVVLDKAKVEGAWVSLHWQGDSLAIAQAFLPTPSDEPEPPAPATDKPFLFAIRQAIVRDAVAVQIPGGLSVEHVDARGELSYSDAYRMTLSFVRGNVAHSLGLLGELSVKSAALRVREQEASRVDAELAFGPESLKLELWTLWGEHGPARGHAKLRGSLSAVGLSAMGLGQSAHLLSGAVATRAELSWDDALENLGLALGLDSAGGAITLEASSRAQARSARLRSEQLSLSRVLTIDGLPALGFDLALEGAPSAPGVQEVALQVKKLTYAGSELPGWTARAKLDATGAHLFALEVPSLLAQRGRITVDVRADYAGDVSGSLTGYLPRVSPGSPLGRLSGARSATLQASARGRYRASHDELSLFAALQVSKLVLAGVSIAAVNASLDANGKLKKPVLRGRANLRGLALGKLLINEAELEARGGPLHYKLSARAVSRKVRATADLALTLAPAEQRLSGSGAIVGWLPQPIVLDLGEVRMRSDAIELHGVRASAGGSLLALEGRFGRTRDSDLHLRVENLALAIPLGAAPGPATHGSAQAEPQRRRLFGRANAHLHLMGRSEQPELNASLRIDDIAFDGAALGTLALEAALESPRSKANARVSLTSPAGDSVLVLLSSELAHAGSLMSRLEQAHHDLVLQGEQDLQHLSEVWQTQGMTVSPSGRLELSAHLHGRLSAPLGELALSGVALALGELGPLDGKLTATLLGTESKLALDVSDSHGTLATLSAALRATVPALRQAIQAGDWRRISAAYQLKLSERRLSELPPPLGRALPLRVALQADMSTDVNAPPRAHLSATLRYAQDEPTPSCPDTALPSLRLSAQLDEERLAATLSGDLGTTHVLDAELSGAMPDLAASQSEKREGNLDLTLAARGIELSRIPFVCGAAHGTLGLSLRGQRLLSPTPTLNAQFDAKGFRFGNAPPVDLSLVAQADRDGLAISSVDVLEGTRRALHADARLPWRWDGMAELTPDLVHGSARAQLSELPLAALLATIPQIAQPAGLATGNLELRGFREPFDARGNLTVKQVAFTLRDPLLRVDGLWASLRLSPDALTLESFKLADQGGTIQGRGRVELKQGETTRGSLSFSAKRYPLRADANVVAYVDGKVDLSATMNQSPRRVRLKLADFSLSLPPRAAREAQALAPHADIVYVDEKTTPEAAKESSEPATPIMLELDAEQPFWVRRDDFGVQLATKLEVDASDQGVRVSGVVHVRRGFINMLSKGFDIERGQFLFDGGPEVDPTVTIDAVHKLGDGQTVTIRVRDRLSAPVVTFSTSVPGVSTDAEVLQLLVRGRNASAAETATAQVGAALAGMTSGLFGSLTRTQFGKYVPVLSLEAGASSGTRMRAGVEANALIPKSLRSVVEGAYIEGFVGSRNQGGNAQATGGVLMELYFPKKVVAGGTWELPNNWSVETTWEP